MNINDYVYLYLFDLEKSLANMDSLRSDRFGFIKNKYTIPNNNGADVMQYDIVLLENNQNISYRSDNLSVNMVSMGQLKDMIQHMDMSSDKKQILIKQINDIIIQ